jgi:cyclopropane fatty-acyl-phospholipid synthase-like methyltransferase
LRTPASEAEAAIRQNRRAYGRIASEWEKRLAAAYDHALHDQCRALFLTHLKGTRVLDAGCGLGLDSLAFAAAGLRVTASDIAEQFLQRLHGQHPRVTLAAMDMTSPCFAPESFDGIYACASFLHVPRELAALALAGFANMLAPEGILFLHHVRSTQGLLSYDVDDLLIRGNPAVCYCHSEDEMAGLLAAVGFQILEVSHLRAAGASSACAARYGLTPYQIVAARRTLPPRK